MAADEQLRAITSAPQSNMERTIHVVANAIAWEMYAERREEGQEVILLEDGEITKVKAAAERVVDHLTQLGVIF